MRWGLPGGEGSQPVGGPEAAGRTPEVGLAVAEERVISEFHAASEGITMRDQVCFGYLNISVQGDVGAVTLDPDFAASEDDQHDWKDAMEWCWARGLRLASEDPALVAGDGTQIFLLRNLDPEPWRPSPAEEWSSGFPLPRGGGRRAPVR